MKRIFALLLVIVMVICLSACKSKEQKTADKILEEYQELMEEIDDASTTQEVEEIVGEIYDKLEYVNTAYEDLKEVDEDAAEEFMDEIISLTNEYLGKYFY